MEAYGVRLVYMIYLSIYIHLFICLFICRLFIYMIYGIFIRFVVLFHALEGFGRGFVMSFGGLQRAGRSELAEFEAVKLQLKRLQKEQEQLGEHLTREMKAIILAEEKSFPDAAEMAVPRGCFGGLKASFSSCFIIFHHVLSGLRHELRAHRHAQAAAAGSEELCEWLEEVDPQRPADAQGLGATKKLIIALRI